MQYSRKAMKQSSRREASRPNSESIAVKNHIPENYGCAGS
jgi:hypothetical protein